MYVACGNSGLKNYKLQGSELLGTRLQGKQLLGTSVGSELLGTEIQLPRKLQGTWKGLARNCWDGKRGIVGEDLGF